MERVGHCILKINSNINGFVCANSQGPSLFLLDADQRGSRWTEHRHLTSSVMRSQMVARSKPVQTPRRRQIFPWLHLWLPTRRTRATKATRRSPLQQRLLQRTPSHRQPTQNHQTGAAILVEHKLLLFHIQINNMGTFKPPVSFSSSSGVFITFTIVGLVMLIALTFKLSASPHPEMDCEEQSMFKN